MKGLGLREGRAAAEHAGRAGERRGAGQEFQGISSVHGVLRETAGRCTDRWLEVPDNCYTVRCPTPATARRCRVAYARGWTGWWMPGGIAGGHQISVSDASRSTKQALDAPRMSPGRAGPCAVRAPAPRISFGAGWSRLPASSKRGPALAVAADAADRCCVARRHGARLARRPQADRRARPFPLLRARTSSRSTSAPRPAASRRCCSTAARRASMRSTSGMASCTRAWPPTRASSRSSDCDARRLDRALRAGAGRRHRRRRELHLADQGAARAAGARPARRLAGGADQAAVRGRTRRRRQAAASCAIRRRGSGPSTLVRDWIAGQPGWRVLDVIASPIAGGSGNQEFLLGATRGG